MTSDDPSAGARPDPPERPSLSPDGLESMPLFGATGPGAAPAPAPLPAWIAGYRILRKIGEGGMGVVYEAEQQEPRRAVALKVIRGSVQDDPQLVRLFEREVQALSRLKHAGIAALHAAGRTESGHPYFVMEMVAGTPLDEFLKSLSPLADAPREAIRRRIALVLKICDAVNFAHQKAVIHRDLKPSNVLVLPGATGRGGRAPEPEVKVLDFGLARFADEEPAFLDTATRIGTVRGTPAYMSPEQARGQNDAVDFRSDVYALGVLLYELLTDRRPYDVQQKPLHEVTRLICEQPTPRPSLVHGSLRGDLDTIVLKALEKDPERRYQGVQALAEDLRRYLADEPILARPPSLAYQLQKLVARHRMPAALAATLILVLVAFAVSMAIQFQAQRRERLRAEAEAAKAETINEFLQEMLRSANPARQGPAATVREVLDDAARTLDTRLADQPEILAAIERTIGNTYLALGLYPEAERHLRGALEKRQGTPGVRAADVATSLRDLGEILWRRGNYGEAEPLLRASLEMRTAQFGAESLPVANSLSALGELLRAAGRPSDSEAAFQRAHRIQQTTLGADDPRVARSATNLAGFARELGQLAQAESLYRYALGVDVQTYGDSSLEASQSLANVALLLRARNQAAEAESLFRKVIAVRQKLLGREHPEMARTLANLAGCLTDQGKFPEAESLSREALEMRVRLLGADHPDVATSLSHLALVRQNLGRMAEAESLYQSSLRLRRKILPAPHRDIITGLANLALCYQAQERDAAAEPLYREALEQQGKINGVRHPDFARIANNLAAVLQNLRRFAEAESLYRQALAIRRESLGPDHPDVATSLNGLGLLMIDQERFDAAEPLLRECLDLRTRKLSKGHWRIAYTASTLGECLVGLRRFAAAESLLVPAWEQLRKARGASPRVRKSALDNVILLYDRWGQPAQATRFRKERDAGGANREG